MPGDTTAGAHAARRIVLDTNVCLDLLLFADSRVAPLARALVSGQVIAAANADTRAEWQRVLGYPALRLEPQRRDGLVEAFDALVLDIGETPVPAALRTVDLPLPRCIDPDDQKFLELARDTGASWLLSRDRDLLVLAARCRRDGMFSVLTPQVWAEEFVFSSAS